MDNNKLMQIFGTEELVKMFEDMSSEIQNKILTTSFRKASKIILDEAKNNLRGTYKHVYTSLGDSMQRDIQTLNIGTIKKKGGYLSHIVNAGTKERAYRTKNGKMHKTGKIIGNNFWDDALTNTESDVEQVIYTDIVERFNKIIQKNNTVK